MWRRGSALAALDGLLELAPRRELRHRGCRNGHFLGRVARVHALALLAVLRRELSEAGERHLSAAPQCLGDRIEESVNGPGGVAAREAGLRCDLVYELLFRQVPLLLSTVRTTGRDPNSPVGLAQPCGFAGVFGLFRMSATRKIGRRRTPRRARASPPPSSRSTTQTAVRTVNPALRSVSTASRTAPPEVTTSSTTHTHSPSSYAPSTRFEVPYSLVCLRTIRNGSPDASEPAAASATAPSSGPARRTASGSNSSTARAILFPSAARMSGRVSNRYLSR